MNNSLKLTNKKAKIFDINSKKIKLIMIAKYFFKKTKIKFKI